MNEYGMLIFSGLAVIVVGYLISIMIKEANRKNTTLGKVFNEHFVKEFETWLTITMILLWVTESLIAASIHPMAADGTLEKPINSVARFMSHFGTALVGIFMVIAFPKVMIEFFESFVTLVEKKGKDKIWPAFYIFINFIMVFVVLYIIIRVPYYNIELIGKGLNDLQNVEYAWYELTRPWSSIDYPRLGLPSDYDPWKEMQFQMFASFLLLMCHYLISLVDGIILLKREVEKKINMQGSKSRSSRRDYSSSQDEKDDVVNNPLNAIKVLLKKGGFYNADKLDEKADHLKEIFLELSHVPEANRERVRTKIAGDMATLIKKWERFKADTEGLTANVKEARRKAIINETRDLFSKQEGFNHQLPGN